MELCINAAYAVVQCLSVSLFVTFVYSVETNKHIFQIFFTLSTHTYILVFPYRISWQYSDGNPLTGALKAGGTLGYEKIAIFDQYLAASRVVNAATVSCYQHGAARPWKVRHTHRW